MQMSSKNQALDLKVLVEDKRSGMDDPRHAAESAELMARMIKAAIKRRQDLELEDGWGELSSEDRGITLTTAISFEICDECEYSAELRDANDEGRTDPYDVELYLTITD